MAGFCRGDRTRAGRSRQPGRPVKPAGPVGELDRGGQILRLAGRWQAAGLLPAGWQVRLPGEAEWEKAARGGLHLPEKVRLGAIGEIDLAEVNQLEAARENDMARRRYPWGDERDPDRANCDETGLNAISAVGCFPGGASPYGAEEMSGNVWEWTRSLWGKDLGNPDYKYPYDPVDGREDLAAGTDDHRVLRGGAFSGYDRNVRCAVRLGDSPYYRFRIIGFRLACQVTP